MQHNHPSDRMTPRPNETSPLTIVTSIAPFELPKQQRAIASWAALGFNVVSLNIERECKILESQFPDVEFHRPPRDGTKIAGKPLVYFNDILRWYADHGDQPICGIVNSDIVMAPVACAMEVLRQSATGGMLISSRIDVDSFDPPIGNWYPEGYDLFFFDRTLIDCYTPSNFMLGMPWWDYWAPSAPLLQGYPVRRLASPLICHEKHPINYSADSHVHFAREYIHHLTGISLAPLRKGLPSAVIEAEYEINAKQLWDETFEFVRSNSAELQVPAFDVAALEQNATWLSEHGHQEEAARMIEMAVSIATDVSQNAVNA
jgi:hypothetical protein